MNPSPREQQFLDELNLKSEWRYPEDGEWYVTFAGLRRSVGRPRARRQVLRPCLPRVLDFCKAIAALDTAPDDTARTKALKRLRRLRKRTLAAYETPPASPQPSGSPV